MRAAVYVRVSTINQVHDQTIEQQLDRLQQHAEQQGWVLPAEHIFRDDGYSGASLKRPALDRLRDQVHSRAFDCLLVTAPDHLPATTCIRWSSSRSWSSTGARCSFWIGP